MYVFITAAGPVWAHEVADHDADTAGPVEARVAQEGFRGKALKATVNNATIPQSRSARRDSVAMHDRKRLPASAAFDALGAEYERAFAESAAHHASLQRLLELLAPHSRVLDVGSGTGRPTAQILAEAGHEVLGVDVSPVMVELARRQVPDASFECADIRHVTLENSSFDAACAYFSLLQMSRDDQSELVRRLGRVVTRGGLLMMATVPLDVEGVDVEFMGQDVQVTSFAAAAFTELVIEAGFSLLWEENTLFTPSYPGGVPEPQLFLLGRRT